MRNDYEDSAAHDRLVDRADAKVVAQRRLIAAMDASDSKLPEARQALAQMLQNAATVGINRAFAGYEAEPKVGQ
jgi:hypothetical protein